MDQVFIPFIEASAKDSFGDKKAKARLSRDAHTKGMLTFPRYRFTFVSLKTATLSPFAEASIENLAVVVTHANESKVTHKKMAVTCILRRFINEVRHLDN